MPWFLTMFGIVGVILALLGAPVASTGPTVMQEIAGTLMFGFGLLLAAVSFGLGSVIKVLGSEGRRS